MIKIDEVIIRKLSHHKVSSNEGKSIISNSLFECEDDDELTIKKILLKPFLNHSQTFEFCHNINLEYNILFNLSKAIYADDDFITNSKDIAQHLISVSKHPNIKDGDLFIVSFEDIKVGNKFIDGIGIFKFEEKENFLETSVVGNSINRKFRKGIGNKKPEKACLILFTEEPFTILVIDNNANDTEYWQNDFIQHKSKNDNINNTNDFLNIAKDFITNQIKSDFDVNKADQIDLLNRSVDYFKTHEVFDKQEFEEEVFRDDSVIESFRNFNQSYQQENDVALAENFEISGQAVKKQARAFKRVLKLDKNFHIYIHGDRDLIEQGIDENGRKFYKIFYEEEK